ncbi:MAG TPA: tRNA pseudouridine(55) synthase TruB [Hyphomonadaceae bacterium]|nr:tRNA pseudouridine(55) synthase TruB [Hyphomonadaceae bacterium]
MARRKKGRDLHGWVVFDKPIEMTSTQAVGAIRRLFNANKAGHAGTLDPLADGILPIALGEATKTVSWLMEAEKVYRFTIRWGVSTASQDREGAVIATSDVRPSPAQIAAALGQFIGEIEQIPPVYSAIKIEGARAYDLARDGETVELAPRPVVLHAAQVIDCPSEDQTVIEARCGKGFYIRALVRDLCQALGAEGHVSALRRTRVGPFHENDAITLPLLEDLSHRDAALERLKPVETALDDIPALAVTEEDAHRLRQGRAIVLLPHVVAEFRANARPRTIAGEDQSRAALAIHRGLAIALGEVRAGKFTPSRVFNLASSETEM